MLVNQPSAMPNRKIWAVIIAGFVVNGAIGSLRQFFPEIAAAMPAQDWVDALAMILAGYFVRERM